LKKYIRVFLIEAERGFYLDDIFKGTVGAHQDMIRLQPVFNRTGQAGVRPAGFRFELSEFLSV